MSSKVLGILGTAKNTGKTTTTSALLEIAPYQGVSVGLTSIGYDGEDIDNITGLPKPRIFAKKGTFIATAKNCLKSSTAQIKTLKETEISTPLGKIIIGEVIENGLVIIAGPNKGEELSMIIDKLEKLGNKLILVDGALNRIVPLMKTNALILTTGAARNINIDFLLTEIKCISSLFKLPKIGKKDLKTNSLISLSDIQELINRLDEETQLVFIPGVLTEFALNELLKKEVKLLKEKNIIIPNPTHLLVGSNTISLMDTLLKIKKIRINLKIVETIPILAITVNPFYPLYRYENSRYEKSWVNREELYNKVKFAVSVPVIDIIKEGGNGLFNIIKKEFNFN